MKTTIEDYYYFPKRIWRFLALPFVKFDQKLDGALVFFVNHWGKTRFMVAMSKKAQYLGLENLFLKGPKAFIYFFIFYLIRDTILYIILPITFATWID
jgi:hypothetical protein